MRGLVHPSEWDGQSIHSVHPLELNDEQFRRWMEISRAKDSRRSIGGSNMAGILGRSRYRTPASVFDYILRLVPDKPFGTEPRQQRGIVLEPIIADLYEKQTGRTLMHEDHTFHHSEHEFLTAHPDRFIVDVDPGILEIKTVDSFTMTQYKNGDVLDEYMIQLQHYMNVCEVSWGSFAVFCADNWELYVMDTRKDEDFVQYMEEQAVRFWNEHIIARVRPSETAVSMPVRMPVTGDVVKRSDDEYVRAMAAVVEASTQKKMAEHAYDLAKSTLNSLMERDGITRVDVNGHKASLIDMKGKEYLDEAALFRDYPFIDLEAYKKRAESGQQFRVWPKKA